MCAKSEVPKLTVIVVASGALATDIDFSTSTSNTIYGAIGVSVWIFKGEIIGDVDLTPGAKTAKEAESSRGRRNEKKDRRPRRRNNRNRNRSNNQNK